MKYLLSLMVVFLFSCKYKSTQQELPQEWYKIQQAFSDDSSGFENMTLRLYEDGNYCRYAVNYYSFGLWKWDKGSSYLVLTQTKGRTADTVQIFEVGKLLSGEFKVQRIKKDGNLTLREKKSSNFIVNENNSKIDPLSMVNNEWRIKPTAPETLPQIKERTVKYFNFLKAYYQHAIDNNLQVITNGWYPAPIQMHFANGVRMAYNNEVKDWYACFYNDEQGIEAYKMIGATVHKLTIPSLENRAERNINIIEQILEKLELPK